MTTAILQIVPRLPGANDGVGDYARTLEQRLSDRWNAETFFATSDSALDHKDFTHVILHYVNYGYQKRGVPFALVSMLRQVRARCSGKFLTIFHELYASRRAPWESAFWLRPFQMQIAKSIAQMSDVAMVSSETMLRQVRQLAPETNVLVQPVFSNFGEPLLSTDQLGNRSLNRWAICGGTVLVERSLRSFGPIVDWVPENAAPRELFVIGGKEIPSVHALVAAVSDRRKTRSGRWQRSESAATTDIRVEYRPNIAATDASQILSSCAFGWLDYFHRPDVPMDVVLKSSAFAALCAHGVIPVFPHPGKAVSITGDALPGPFFVDQNSNNFPATDALPAVAVDLHQWYRRHAASAHAATKIAAAFRLPALA